MLLKSGCSPSVKEFQRDMWSNDLKLLPGLDLVAPKMTWEMVGICICRFWEAYYVFLKLSHFDN